jgi:hypothetical protein
MNAPPFPTNPSFGQYFGNWVWSGSRWVCTNTNGVRLITTVFTASAPYTPSPGLISLVVETVGGGGGSGPAVGFANYITSGGGGGSGGYSRITLASGLVLGGVNVIIGAGGSSTQSLPPGAASTGGTTSFGAFCVANGGQGGYGNDGATEFGNGGPGAAPGVGDIAAPGSFGVNGETMFVTAGGPMVGMDAWGGRGATTLFGGGNQQAAGPGESIPGVPGAGYGAGATGGISNQINAQTAQGAAGAAGVCIVTEYCWADAIDDGCGCGPTSGQARVAIGGPQGRHSWGYEDGE